MLDEGRAARRDRRPAQPIGSSARCSASTTLKVALHKAKGTPLPDGLAGLTDKLDLEVISARDRGRYGRRVPARLVEDRPRGKPLRSASTTAAARFYAIEDRCSHDDGPLCEGDWDEDRCCVGLPPPRVRSSSSRNRAADLAAGHRARRDLSGPRRRRHDRSRAPRLSRGQARGTLAQATVTGVVYGSSRSDPENASPRARAAGLRREFSPARPPGLGGGHRPLGLVDRVAHEPCGGGPVQGHKG